MAGETRVAKGDLGKHSPLVSAMAIPVGCHKKSATLKPSMAVASSTRQAGLVRSTTVTANSSLEP